MDVLNIKLTTGLRKAQESLIQLDEALAKNDVNIAQKLTYKTLSEIKKSLRSLDLQAKAITNLRFWTVINTGP